MSDDFRLLSPHLDALILATTGVMFEAILFPLSFSLSALLCSTIVSRQLALDALSPTRVVVTTSAAAAGVLLTSRLGSALVSSLVLSGGGGRLRLRFFSAASRNGVVELAMAGTRTHRG